MLKLTVPNVGMHAPAMGRVTRHKHMLVELKRNPTDWF